MTTSNKPQTHTEHWLVVTMIELPLSHWLLLWLLFKLPPLLSNITRSFFPLLHLYLHHLHFTCKFSIIINMVSIKFMHSSLRGLSFNCKSRGVYVKLCGLVMFSQIHCRLPLVVKAKWFNCLWILLRFFTNTGGTWSQYTSTVLYTEECFWSGKFAFVQIRKQITFSRCVQDLITHNKNEDKKDFTSYWQSNWKQVLYLM